MQSILRHSRIRTTLDLYIQCDGDETRAVQGAFLNELGLATERFSDCLQAVGWVVGLARGTDFPASLRKPMVGAIGFEPMTSTVRRRNYFILQ